MSGARFADLRVGMTLPQQTFELRRFDLVRYAGASGDFNQIHWDQHFATEVGLPGVIAHGMLTMAEAARVVTDWAGDPGAVLDYVVRFTRPVVVPDGEQGARLVVGGAVKELDAETRTAVVALTATAQGQSVLARARAVVRLD